MVPEERGGELCPSGILQPRAADREPWSHTGECRGMAPPWRGVSPAQLPGGQHQTSAPSFPQYSGNSGFCLPALLMHLPQAHLSCHRDLAPLGVIADISSDTRVASAAFMYLKMQVIPGHVVTDSVLSHVTCTPLNYSLWFFTTRASSAVLATSSCPTAAKQYSTQKAERLCCDSLTE